MVRRGGPQWVSQWLNWTRYPGNPLFNRWGTQGPVRVGDEYFFYLSGVDGDMLSAGRLASIGVARLRLDGFVSLGPERGRGTLLTKPFLFEGRELRLNVDPSRGRVRVAIHDKIFVREEQALAGYSLAECDPINCDGVSVPVTWNGRGDLRALVGRPIRLLIEIEGGRLYAFQFTGEAESDRLAVARLLEADERRA